MSFIRILDSVGNSLQYFYALQRFDIPSEIHIYQTGKHGFGLGNEGTSKHWTEPCEAWLRFNHYADLTTK